MSHIQNVIELHGIVFSIIGIVFLLMNRIRKNDGRNILILALLGNIGVLASDYFSFNFDGLQGQFGYYIVSISNFSLYAFEIFLLIVIGHYLHIRINRNGTIVSKRWLKILHGIGTVDFFGLLLNPFIHLYYYINSNNEYCRTRFFFLCIVCATLMMSLELYQIYRYNSAFSKDEIFAIVAYFFFPGIGLVIQILKYGVSFMDIGLTISVLILIIQFEYSERRFQKEQEQKLLQSRAYLLNSQIKPHFIFNCLSVIQALIDIEPDTAVDAISHFSRYMRKSLDLTVAESAIPIREELDFVDNYLYMEQLRFGEKLNVEYDIDESLDFNIPYISIQPVVENAVRYGIRQKLEAGTVTIRVFSKPGWNVVEVLDDGIGFDPKNPDTRVRDRQSNGVGLKNVEERIKLMCDGKITIESQIGVGTKVQILLPKKG